MPAACSGNAPTPDAGARIGRVTGTTLKVLASALLAALAAGCASVPAPEPPPEPATQAAPAVAKVVSYFNDERFAPPTVRVSADDVLAMSDEMRRYLESDIVDRVKTRGRQVALVEALYTKSQLKLEYDSTLTRNASEAFASRSGNCMSLVLMTAAFAKALDLTVTFQKAVIEDEIGRDGDIFMSVGHVNVTLARRKTEELGYGYNAGKRRVEVDRMTIDFLPPDELRSMKTRTIDERTIVAMYLNNRAVEALARGRVDDAYWWAREAILQAPDYVSPYNTLGVVYARHRDAGDAERTLRYVLDRDPGNTLAMSNLVNVLAETGRDDESRRIAATLSHIDPEPPFSYFIRGMAAMRAGDYRTAKDAFAKEVARAPNYHEFQFWLAAAEAGLGEIDDARMHMELAIKHSTSRREHDIYAAKLDRLTRAR